jgi:hypothetical protein
VKQPATLSRGYVRLMVTMNTIGFIIVGGGACTIFILALTGRLPKGASVHDLIPGMIFLGILLLQRVESIQEHDVLKKSIEELRADMKRS